MEYQLNSITFEKKCFRCKEIKHNTEFNTDSSKKDKLHSYCRKCVRAKYVIDNDKRRKMGREGYYRTKSKDPDKFRTKARNWYHKNSLYVKSKLLVPFWPGSTPEEALDKYNLLSKEQNEKCKVCNQPETYLDNKTRKLHKLVVDHCHTTGTVRGLLCRNCNLGLGHFKDNPELLLKASIYLNMFNK